MADELGSLDAGELADERRWLDEPLDFGDETLERLLKESDELGRELLWSELLGELLEELSEERLERDRLLASELRRLLLGLSCDELGAELDALLLDESLDGLDDNDDDSLTLENDLLDP